MGHTKAQLETIIRQKDKLISMHELEIVSLKEAKEQLIKEAAFTQHGCIIVQNDFYASLEARAELADHWKETGIKAEARADKVLDGLLKLIGKEDESY